MQANMKAANTPIAKMTQVDAMGHTTDNMEKKQKHATITLTTRETVSADKE